MPHHSRPRDAFRGRAIAAAVGLTLAAIMAWCPVALAAQHAGCQTVHVGPEIAPGAPPASYLTLTVKRGAVTHAAVIAANPERYSCGVRLLPAYGKTAQNSGDSYTVDPGLRHCAITSCWLSGLPLTVTVPAGGRVRVPFTIGVPAGTPSGQYLAGVVAGPSEPPARPRFAVGHDVVGAAVVARVAIGVAIIVPGPLVPQLRIPWVKLDATSDAAALNVTEQNGGNTWEHPEGQVLITTDERVQTLTARPRQSNDRATLPVVNTFSIRSRTILAGDSATLPLAIGTIPRGTWPTEVDLWYDHHHKLAVWRGQISYPSPSGDAGGASAPGANDSSTSPSLPAWAKLLIGALAGLSAALGLFVLFLLGRRRRREA